MHKAQDAPAGGQRVSRTAAVLLATGSFAMLVGAVFLLPFLLSVRAEQNDVFFSNLFIGPVFFAIGSTLLVGSLAGLGLKGWITFALAIGNPAAVVLLLWLASTTGLAGPGAIAATLWADAGILVAASIAVAGINQRWQPWGRGVQLGVAGAGVVSLVYSLFGGRYYAYAETASSLPPYLDLPVLELTLALGSAIFVISWIWSTG